MSRQCKRRFDEHRMGVICQVSPTSAQFWRNVSGNTVQCLLCPRECKMDDGQRGACLGRENRGGRLIAASYGRVCSVALDPMEKKPLYQFYPGSSILSLGTYGCNLHCDFCQNWRISHPSDEDRISTRDIAPNQVPALIDSYRGRGCVGAAYTYSEPTVWYEYVFDAASLTKEAGYVNVLVTNGHLQEEPWRELMGVTDACNIDVKGFSPDFYREYCGGDLDVVKRNTEIAVDMGVHVEVTTLLVPGGTDAPEDIAALVDWLAGIDTNIPLHFSRYFPHHRMQRPPTPRDTLIHAKEIGMQKLNNIYLGNLLTADGADTVCPDCGTNLIERDGYQVQRTGVDSSGRCGECGYDSGIVVSSNEG